jgi:predicted membrane GTPase involved in stress response
MHLDMPIEQLVRRKDTRFQFGFATEARNLVPDRGDFVLATSHKGLHVLARDEESLAAPVEVLREVYGPDLDVAPPRVRLIEGVQVQEPIMNVRISVAVRFLNAVKSALLARGANPSEEYVRAKYCVLRYEAPLASLLGLPAQLARLTHGTAKHWILLSHYALVTGDPGGGRAA